jgi:NAD(P)-dependent dehydrogenase (short-subunit alcohol dehydrogenase family)
MDYHLEGKLAFITAGAHGIGEATANLLMREGARVIVADLDREALEVNGRHWAGTFAADLATPQGVQSAIDFVLRTFGRCPDILINNLGLGDAAPFEELTDERWARAFEMNLMGCVRTCRAIIPQMAALSAGSVVNTGSDLAKQPESGLMDYGAFKSGLLYLSKALARQYAPHVRVNVVSPGPVWTRMWSRPGGIADQLAARYGVDRDLAVQQFLKDRQLPLGMGQPEDVAHAVVFLASPLAKWITGANLDLGGTLRGLI